MKLEIDIPSIIYNDAKENRGYISVGKMEIAWKAIADGKPLEQEPVIDKIRAKIEQLPTATCTETRRIYIDVDDFKENVLAILDKYKAESEV